MVACCCDRHGFSRIVKFEHLDIYPSQIVMLYHKTPGWISCQSNHLLFFSKGTSEKFRKKHIFWADDLFRRYLAVNNWFIRQRAFTEIWSTREVWRARKMRKSCSRRSREQLLLLSCSPSFPSASYLDERTADVWSNCSITFSTRWKIFFSRDLFADVWAWTIGIWSTLAQ